MSTLPFGMRLPDGMTTVVVAMKLNGVAGFVSVRREDLLGGGHERDEPISARHGRSDPGTVPNFCARESVADVTPSGATKRSTAGRATFKLLVT